MKKAEQYARQYLEREVSEVRRSPRIEEHLELTLFEKALIYKYSEDGYESVNESLRKSQGRVHNPPNEKEVLFRPNRTFRVLEVSKELSRTVITMEEV